MGLFDRFSILFQDVVLDPQEILALYASEAQLERGHTVSQLKFCTSNSVFHQVTLGDIKCQNQNIFLVIETTCPLPRVAPPPAPRDDTVVLDMKDFPLEVGDLVDDDFEHALVPVPEGD